MQAKKSNWKCTLTLMAMALIVFAMTFVMLPTQAFAKEETPVLNEVTNEKANATDVDPDINRGASITIEAGQTGGLELELTKYEGITYQFFVLATSESSEGTIQLSLYGSDLELYSDEWTINCNEYKMWTVPNPPEGKWYLMITPSGIEGSVTVFARWN